MKTIKSFIQYIADWLQSKPEYKPFLLKIFPNVLINSIGLILFLIIIFGVLKLLYNLLF